MKERNALYKELLSLKNTDVLSGENEIFTTPVRTVQIPGMTNQLLCSIRFNSVMLALQEEKNWTLPSGSKLLESNPSALPLLTKYWKGVLPVVNATRRAKESATQTGNGSNWGGAFISWLFRSAGASPSFNGFPASGRNIINIVAGLRNRFRASSVSEHFMLFSPAEIAFELSTGIKSFQPGDVLCFNRFINGRQTTFHTFDDLHRLYVGNTKIPSTGANCEIIIPQSISSSDVLDGDFGLKSNFNFSQTTVLTLGGNINNTVTRKTYSVNAAFNIVTPAPGLFIGLLRYPVVNCSSPNPII